MNQEVKIINGYAVKDEKAIRTYDTVALMKSDRNLKQGQHVKTRGYYSVGDGGSAEYYITTQSLTDYQENLGNGLYATLIIKGIANIMQYGVSPLNNDNTNALNNAFSFNTNLEGFDETINVSGALIIEHNEVNYDFKGLTINAVSDSIIDKLISIYSNNTDRIKGFFKNLNIKANGIVNSSLCIYDTRNTYFDNLNITGSLLNEIYVVGGKNTTGCNLTLENCRLENGRKDNLSVCENCVALNINDHITDSYFNNIVSFEYNKHIINKGFNWFNKIHSWNWNNILDTIMFDNYGSCTLNNIMCDTIETFMKCNVSSNIIINNVRSFYNTQAPGITNLIPQLFLLENDFITNYGRLRITSSGFQNYGNGGNDLIVLPNGRNDIPLNMVNISNSYTGTYKVIPHCLDYYQKNLTLDFTNYSIINHRSDTETMKKIINIKGLSLFKIQLYSTSITITPKTWTALCLIEDELLTNKNKVMLGYIFNGSDGSFITIRWRINNNNEIELYVQDNLPTLTSFTIYLEDYNIIEELTNN